MPYSLEQQLTLLGHSVFEELCGKLVDIEFQGQSIHIDGRGGDSGIDIHIGELDRGVRVTKGSLLRVWQVKFFRDRIRHSQRNQIIKSLDQAIVNHNPDFWTLCLPINLTIEEMQWFENLIKEYKSKYPKITIEKPLLANDIIVKCLKDSAKSILDCYFLKEQPYIDSSILSNIISRLDDFDDLQNLITLISNKTESESSSAEYYYNGTIPSWHNIISNHDAPRELMGDIWKFISERSNQANIGRIPLALILGGSTDGKSTLLMRLGHELTKQDTNLVYYHKGTNYQLNPDQFVQFNVTAGSYIILLIDGIGNYDTNEIERFFERLHRCTVRVIIIATSLISLWKMRRQSLNNVAEVQEFAFDLLSETDASAILDKWSEDTSRSKKYLGELSHLSRKDQLDRIHKKNKPLGVLLQEIKNNINFDAFIIREFTLLENRFGNNIKKSVVYVSSLYMYDVAMPCSLLEKLFPSENIYGNILRNTQGFMFLQESRNTHIILRHAYYAETIFWNEIEYGGERIWYEHILSHMAVDGIEDIAVVIALKRMALKGKCDLVYQILLPHADSSSPELLSLLAFYHKKNKKYEDSRSLLRKASIIDPNRVWTWLAWAQLEAEMGNLGSLEEEFTSRWLFQKTTTITDDPHPGLTWHSWGRIEEQAGNIGFNDASEPYSARWLYKKATEIDPTMPHAWVSWANLEIAKNNLGEFNERLSKKKAPKNIITARNILKHGIHIQNAHPSIWRNFAMKEAEHGNWGQSKDELFSARWLYFHLLRVDPNDSISWRGWATLESRLENFGDSKNDEYTARWLFWRGTVANSKDAATWHAWGNLEEYLGNLGGNIVEDEFTARWLYHKAIEAAPEMPHGWTSLAYLESKLGNIGRTDLPGTARYFFEKATNLAPENTIIWSKWAQIEKKQEQYSDAEKYFIKAAEVNDKPTSRSQNYCNAARMAGKSGNQDNSLKYLVAAIKHDPNNAYAHGMLGRHHSYHNNWAEAETHLDLAIELKPNEENFRKWIEHLERAKHHETKGRR